MLSTPWPIYGGIVMDIQVLCTSSPLRDTVLWMAYITQIEFGKLVGKWPAWKTSLNTAFRALLCAPFVKTVTQTTGLAVYQA